MNDYQDLRRILPQSMQIYGSHMHNRQSFQGNVKQRRRKKLHLAWEEADRQSDGQYSNYLQEVARHFPCLTSMELKTCALIKAMKASWEIAEMLGVSERTIENHRVNIRRKIGVIKGISLTSKLLCL